MSKAIFLIPSDVVITLYHDESQSFMTIQEYGECVIPPTILFDSSASL